MLSLVSQIYKPLIFRGFNFIIYRNMTKKILKFFIIVGARPNFIKVAALMNEVKKYSQIKTVLVHTGQHYDYEMSQIFFKELNIPIPDYNLEVGSGSHTAQTAKIMLKLEKIALKENPDLVIAIGDVNSTLAGALVAVKMHIPVAHIEAGLRGFNKNAPEEINRILTDHISDYLFCPTIVSVENLKNEGIKNSVYKTGDIMRGICLETARLGQEKSEILTKFSLKPKNYYLATIHRPQNTDYKKNLEKIVSVLCGIENLIFPCHPRTEQALKKFKLWSKLNKFVNIIKPLGYLDIIWLIKNAKKIITDSGGIQKEAYWLKTPCVTIRNKTEWLMTLNNSANILTDCDENKIIKAVLQTPRKRMLNQDKFYSSRNTADKILKILIKELSKQQ